MESCGYTTFTRVNGCDIIAWMRSLTYLIECKGYSLSPKQQFFAARQLNNNYKNAKSYLEKIGLRTEMIVKVLIAYKFSHFSKGVYQFTPEEFTNHMVRV